MKKLKDCVEFGNKLAYIKISLENSCCYCQALCSGLFALLSQLGTALIITMVAKFFAGLGYLIIMAGGAFTCFAMNNYASTTVYFGNSTNVPQPFTPIIVSGILS